MTSFLSKLKSLAIVLMAFSFFMGMTLSSCGGKSGESEGTEVQASEDEEHPEGEEHPSDEEEHPDEEEESEE